jgi:hypothetical protein
VIALGQAWISKEESNKAIDDDWEDGHYIVLLAVDKDYVYFEDPYARMGKGFTPRQKFEEHWHNIGGKTPDDTAKQMHLGIFIKGKKPAKHQYIGQADLSKLDFGKLAPLHLVVVSFKGQLLPYDIVEEMRPILESGFVRLASYLFLYKDKDGKLTALEGGNLTEEDEIVEIDAIMATLASLGLGERKVAKIKAEAAAKAASEGDFGLSDKDIHRIGERLPNDSSAVILLIEHLWGKKLKEIIGKHGGVVHNQMIITEDILYKWEARLKGAKNT